MSSPTVIQASLKVPVQACPAQNRVGAGGAGRSKGHPYGPPNPRLACFPRNSREVKNLVFSQDEPGQKVNFGFLSRLRWGQPAKASRWGMGDGGNKRHFRKCPHLF